LHVNATPAPAGKCVITFNTDQFRPSNLSSCNLKGHLGTALPPGSSVVLDRASDTLVPCTPLLCPYAIPSARDSGVLVNFVPISTPVIVTYLPDPALVVDASAALGAFAIHNTIHYNDYRQAYAESLLPWEPSASAPPTPGLTDAAIAAAVAAVAERSTSMATPTGAINPRPLLRLGYDLNDTVEVLQIHGEILAFINTYRGSPCPGVSYFRCAACAGPRLCFCCSAVLRAEVSAGCSQAEGATARCTVGCLHVHGLQGPPQLHRGTP
jgi:hypothetical protein